MPAKMLPLPVFAAVFLVNNVVGNGLPTLSWNGELVARVQGTTYFFNLLLYFYSIPLAAQYCNKWRPSRKIAAALACAYIGLCFMVWRSEYPEGISSETPSPERLSFLYLQWISGDMRKSSKELDARDRFIRNSAEAEVAVPRLLRYDFMGYDFVREKGKDRWYGQIAAEQYYGKKRIYIKAETP